MSAAWHVVFTDLGRERRAASDLCCLPGVDGFCPSMRARYFFHGRIITRIAPLIPRTIFARWDDDPYIWHEIKNTLFVRRILGDDHPVVVHDESLDLWWRSADDEWCIPIIAMRLALFIRRYWEQSAVVINYRVLQGVRGIVQRIDEDTMSAVVEYNLIGRSQLIRCPLTALLPAP